MPVWKSWPSTMSQGASVSSQDQSRRQTWSHSIWSTTLNGGTWECSLLSVTSSVPRLASFSTMMFIASMAWSFTTISSVKSKRRTAVRVSLRTIWSSGLTFRTRGTSSSPKIWRGWSLSFLSVMMRGTSYSTIVRSTSVKGLTFTAWKGRWILTSADYTFRRIMRKSSYSFLTKKETVIVRGWSEIRRKKLKKS